MLTPRQHDLLKFIEAYTAKHGHGPSYEEMAAGIGLSAKSRIFELVKCLEQRGHIRKLPNHSRSIEVIRPCAIHTLTPAQFRFYTLARRYFQTGHLIRNIPDCFSEVAKALRAVEREEAPKASQHSQ